MVPGLTPAFPTYTLFMGKRETFLFPQVCLLQVILGSIKGIIYYLLLPPTQDTTNIHSSVYDR